MTVIEAVVDASAMAKLMRREPERDAFRAWFASATALHAPTILPYELANLAMRENLASEFAALAPTLARVHLHPGPGDVWPWKGRLTAYDAAYAALAKRLRTALVTYDRALADAADVLVLAPGRE